MVAWISRIDKRTAEVLDHFCIFCLVVVMVLILIGVFARLTGVVAFSWLEEIIYLALSWMVFVKTALIFRKNDHLTIETLSDFLCRTESVRRIYRIVIYTIILITLVAFGVFSFILCCTTSRGSDVLDISFKYWYFSLSFSLFLSSIYIIAHIIKELKR